MYAVGSAAKKLLYSAFDPDDRHQALAVLSQRAVVPLSESRNAKSFEQKGVRSHMRTLRGVVNPPIVKTAVPSEPMLAIAAAKIMSESTVKGRIPMRS